MEERKGILEELKRRRKWRKAFKIEKGISLDIFILKLLFTFFPPHN